MKTNIALAVFAIIIVSCSPNDTRNKSIIDEEVRAMFTAYDDSVRVNGLEGEFDFLDNSDEFYWVPPGYKYAIGYDSVATILHQNAPTLTYVDNTWDTLHIMVLSKNYASFSGVVNSLVITTSNDTIRTKLAETGLVVRRKTGWKLLSGQTNLINE